MILHSVFREKIKSSVLIFVLIFGTELLACSLEISNNKTANAGIYKELDDYARETPRKYEKNIDELANYLVKPAKTEIEKTRLIFSWVAFHIKYDAKAYNSGDYGDLSPESVLKRKNAVCEGYCSLFQALSKVGQLECEVISGYGKGYGYRNGKKFSKTNHAWNAVKINGEWKLFDVTWASGYGVTERGKLVSYSKFDDYWFDVNPSEFIFFHLPADPKWQFNKPVLSLKQYEELACVTPPFFKLGFDANDVLKNALKENDMKFVESFPTDYPVKIIHAPYEFLISSRKEIEFILESAEALEIAAINNKKWNSFAKNGNKFSLTIKPENGELKISVKYPQDKMFYSVLSYKVKNIEN